MLGSERRMSGNIIATHEDSKESVYIEIKLKSCEYLNIVDNLITVSNLLDIEIDKILEGNSINANQNI